MFSFSVTSWLLASTIFFRRRSMDREQLMDALKFVCKPDFWRMALLWHYSLIISYFQLFAQRFFFNKKPVLHFRPFPSPIHSMPICVITGATSGLGAAAAYALSMEGFYVVLAGRSYDSLTKVISHIKKRNAGACVKGFQVDVSSFQSMLEFESSLKQWLLDSNMHSSMQVLINNAGILATSHRLTPEGYDMMMATNYIGAFCLTRLLVPLLQSSPVPSRVVNISSFTHRSVSSMQIDKETVSGKVFSGSPCYPFARVYEYSKMCVLLFSYELNRQIRSSEKCQQITAVAVDPGAVNTNIMREFPSYIQQLAFIGLELVGLVKSPENAAQSVLDAVLASPEIKDGYFFGGKGRSIKSSEYSYNSKLSKDLWDVSSDIFMDLQHSSNCISS